MAQTHHNDGYVPLAEDVIADLWACDYPNVRFTNNVNATPLPDSQTLNEDGTLAAVPANAFQPPVAPRLAVRGKVTRPMPAAVAAGTDWLRRHAGLRALKISPVAS